MVYCMYFFSFSKLDEILKKEEKASCQTYFRKVLSENRNLAIKLVNDTRITFPCFFVLMPVVEKENIYSLLREDLKKAYDFSKSVSANKPSNLKKILRIKSCLNGWLRAATSITTWAGISTKWSMSPCPSWQTSTGAVAARYNFGTYLHAKQI